MSARDEGVRRLFDALAPDYDDRFPDTVDLLAEFVARMPPGGRVLDVGCGGGTNLAAMARAGLRVAGIDVSPAMVREARRRHPGIDVRVQDMRELRGRGVYDGIVAAYALIFLTVEEVPRALARLGGLLVPGGLLLVAVQEGNELSDGVPLIFTHEGIRERVQAAGFRISHDFGRAPKPHEMQTRKRVLIAQWPGTEPRPV